jgi:membrane protein implicated in regulation of membrane protease activity
MDLLPLSTFGVFLATCAAGFVFLMASLIFGEMFEFFDTDIDAGGPGIFSSRVIGVFITAFGGFGAIGVYYGLSPVGASLLGIASGVIFAAAIYSIARFLYRQQASSDVLSSDLVGQSCRVVISIPSGGMGQVRCRIGEELVDKIAQARDGGAIPANTPVHIEEVLGETVIVSRHH